MRREGTQSNDLMTASVYSSQCDNAQRHPLSLFLLLKVFSRGEKKRDPDVFKNLLYKSLHFPFLPISLPCFQVRRQPRHGLGVLAFDVQS